MESSPKSSLQLSRFYRSHRAEIFASALLGVIAAIGCTFVNSFGDVKTTGAPGTDSGLTGDTKVGSDSNVGGDSDSTSPPDDSDTAPPPPTGLIVVGGVLKDSSPPQGILSVIDPATGKELKRENINASGGILYDGSRDIWYIFADDEPTHTAQPAPNDTITLHVRTWKGGDWVTDNTFTGLPTPVGQDTTVMTEKEIVYVGYKKGASPPSYQIIPVSVASDPAVIASGPIDIAQQPLAALGSRQTISGKTGGTFNMLVTQCASGADAGAGCALDFDHWTIPDSYNPPFHDTAAYTIISDFPVTGTTPVTPGFGQRIGGSTPENFIALNLPSDTNGNLYRINPTSPVSSPPDVTFTYTSGNNHQLKPIALDECDEVAFVPELLSSKIYFVPLDSSTKPFTLALGHPAQRAAWEPFTHTLIAPFNQGGGGELTAYSITFDSGGAVHEPVPTRTGASWAVPDAVLPNIVVTKIPVDTSYCGLK